jgi:FtsZ-binding cell division protein ZapB
LQSTIKILLDEIKGLFEKQNIKFENELNDERKAREKLYIESQELKHQLFESKHNFDKKYKSMVSELTSLKEQHKEEVEKLNRELQKKNSKIFGQLK